MVRKKFSPTFKAKVALEAIQGDSTMAELSQKHGVHQSQIKDWKNELTSRAESLFAGKIDSKDNQVKYIEALERKAGQLVLENDFLKKNLFAYPGKKD